MWPKTGGQTHHAVAQITVEGKVGRQRYQTLCFRQVFDLEPRGSHGNSQGFGFIAAGDGATIVIAKHAHRQAIKTGTKHPLA